MLTRDLFAVANLLVVIGQLISAPVLLFIRTQDSLLIRILRLESLSD